MSNVELTDDYLANRLQGQDREAFERQLANDPALKADIEFQKQVIEGIRKARIAELKQMLSKVPLGGGIQVDFSIARLAAGVITAGVISAALYFYIKPEQLPSIDDASADLNGKTEKVEPAEPSSEPGLPATPPADNTEKASAPPVEKKKTEIKKTEDVREAEKPKLDVADPPDELTDENKEVRDQPVKAHKPEVAAANVEVELNSSNKKYDFHYQFSANKLLLFGSFDKSLYEILEINGDGHALFLFYKDNFYLLDEAQKEITRLSPIKDGELLEKLKEYRSR